MPDPTTTTTYGATTTPSVASGPVGEATARPGAVVREPWGHAIMVSVQIAGPITDASKRLAERLAAEAEAQPEVDVAYTWFNRIPTRPYRDEAMGT
jgi:hypothetical protein